MATYNWYAPGSSLSGCPGTAMTGGWYEQGSSTPIVTTYINPNTGKPYTQSELSALAGGTTTTTPTTPTTTTPAATTTTPSTALPTTYMSFASWVGYQGLSLQSLDDMEKGQLRVQYNKWLADLNAGTTAATTTTTPTTPGTTTQDQTWSSLVGLGGGETTAASNSQVPLPSLGNVNVPAPAVTPAPAFELSPEQKAWQEKIGGYISETLEMGGRGIPQETMDLMVGKTIDTLKAKETEDLRVMKNNMERRGITNSGFIFSNEQKIRSGTTIALAKSITDLNIQNQLMKLASFENTMGQAAQFLGYLGEMSQLKYQPAYATWQAQQQANLYQYQAKMELYKTQLVQAYAQQNMQLQAQLNMQAQNDQQAFELQIAEMEIEAANQQAAAEGIGSIFGTTIGAIFGKL